MYKVYGVQTFRESAKGVLWPHLNLPVTGEDEAQRLAKRLSERCAATIAFVQAVSDNEIVEYREIARFGFSKYGELQIASFN